MLPRGHASVAATKEVVRGCLDTLQRYTSVGPRLGTAMNAANALIDQRFTADINIFPQYGMSSLGKILKILSEEEMVALIRAGERATWPKIPMIGTTTRIGRTLDRILHDFEVDESHWLKSAPQTDATLNPKDIGVKTTKGKKTSRRRSARTRDVVRKKASSGARG